MVGQNNNFNKALPWVIGASTLLNMLFVVYLVVQSTAIHHLESVYLEEAPTNVAMTQKLADIERSIGYVGFIHHFKNYIIRRDDKYYVEAMQSYSAAIDKIVEFESLTNKKDLIHEIEHLKATLEEYHNNLQVAKSSLSSLSVNALDQNVKVDDRQADTALRALQTYLLPRFENIHQKTTLELSKLSHLTLIFNLIIALTIVIVSYFIVQIIHRVHKLTNQLTSILEISPDGIIYLSEQGKILQANSRACKILEYSEKELTSIQLEQLIAPDFRPLCSLYREKVSQNHEHLSDYKPHKILAITKSGKHVELEITIASQEIARENRSVCVIRDMTHHNTLKQRAEKDRLTGLLNRWMLDELLQKEIERCKRSQQSLALFMIDLDNFKQVNDTWGHDIGDSALRETADFLLSNSRTYDHIARWGGDEFVLVCPNLSHQDAINYAHRFTTKFRQLNIAHDKQLSLSIGVATSALTNTSKQTLFKNADLALYQTKSNGKDGVTYYHDHKVKIEETA